MPWSNFAHLTVMPAADAIGIKGPGTITISVPFSAAGAQLLPLALELGTGKPAAAAPPEVSTFANAQAAKVRHYQVDPNFWLPQWVRDHIDAKGSPDDLIQKVMDRVKATPNAQSLLEAQTVLNELGRSSEGTAAIRNAVTKPVIRQAVQGGK